MGLTSFSKRQRRVFRFLPRRVIPFSFEWKRSEKDECKEEKEEVEKENKGNVRALGGREGGRKELKKMKGSNEFNERYSMFSYS